MSRGTVESLHGLTEERLAAQEYALAQKSAWKQLDLDPVREAAGWRQRQMVSG